MAIDMNGDGRIDLIDAAEQPNVWVVYLNTPDPNHQWQRRTISISYLRSNLLLLGGDTDYVPLARRRSGLSGRDLVYCGKWRPITRTYESYPQGWSDGSCQPLYDDMNPPLADHWRAPACFDDAGMKSSCPYAEQSFTEWELKDINGDGYPDFVFNRYPVIDVGIYQTPIPQPKDIYATISEHHFLEIHDPTTLPDLSPKPTEVDA